MDCTRRKLVTGLTLGATGGLLGVRPKNAGAEPPPEIATLKFAQTPFGICIAPQYIAEELLRIEGFRDV
jgi:NitT/TauT family transport system substrate-binding protein